MRGFGAHQTEEFGVKEAKNGVNAPICMNIRKSGQFWGGGACFLPCQAGNPGDAQTTKVLSANSKADRLAVALGKCALAEVPNFCSLALVANSACC